MFVFVHVI
jgi:hypothetical protein